MKYINLKAAVAPLFALFLVGCSVDHTGLLPSDSESRIYSVSCRVVIDYQNSDGVPVSEDITVTGRRVCSNGPPNSELMERSCDVTVRANRENYEMMYPGYRGMPFFEAISSDLVEGDVCWLPQSVEEGFGEVLSRTDGLVSGSSGQLLPNEVGIILGGDSITNSRAVVVNSDITVGAKFLEWRYANTTAQGDIDFDRFNCNAENECDMVLRNISLDFEDFTIVRPTIFARDVTIRNAKLYSLTSRETRVASDGSFTIDGVDTIISSEVDGEKVNLVNGSAVQISGKFNHYLHDQGHAALTLGLTISSVTDSFSVKTNATLNVNKFPSKLATGKKDARCLTGGIVNVSRDARVSACDLKEPFQAWSFEQKGRYLRIRQRLSNNCLNLKKVHENYEGGVVSIVNCSDHWDQLWRVDHDFNVINLHTQKCLDVGGNKTRPEDDLVTVRSCNLKSSSQDWTMRRPG